MSKLIAEEPAPRKTPSPWTRTLNQIVEEHPHGGSVRVRTLTALDSADVLASMLRHGRRGAERPAGTWTFHSAAITEGSDAGQFGVWATYAPPDD